MAALRESAPLSEEALGFSIFCVENLAIRLNIEPSRVYRALTMNSDLLDSYVIPCYDVLHTQGKDYILDDLQEVMRMRGVTV